MLNMSALDFCVLTDQAKEFAYWQCTNYLTANYLNSVRGLLFRLLLSVELTFLAFIL